MENFSRPPYLFDEFFASGKEESISPFLTPNSRKWGKNLSLKAALLSAFFLVISFILYFFSKDLSHGFLVIVYVLSGTPALIATIQDIKDLEINIDVLMTLAALLSVVIGSGLEGALLLVLFELSSAMELAVMQKTKEGLAKLHKLSPESACFIGKDGHLFQRSIKEIPIGANILIKAGEIVPLDGKVVDGSSFITLSHITGESIPIPKAVGDEVSAGSRNLEGTLTLAVLRTSRESTLSKIIELVTHAQDSKPKLQRWMDRFDKKYATTIIFLTAFFAAFLPFFFPKMPYLGIEGSIYRSLTFLIAASPCALIIATPTAYLSAISSCAKKGILLKGGSILDALARCKLIAFDKTGTLTTGRLRCIEIKPLNAEATSLSAHTAICLAGSMERHAKHPIADALVDLVKEKNLSFMPVSDLKALAGFGILAQSELGPCFLGSESFISSQLTSPFPKAHLSTLSSTQTYLLVNRAIFAFYFQDEIRKEAKPLLQRLYRDLKIGVSMLTGDEEKNAHAIATELGITSVFSQLKPEDKLQKVAELSQNQGLIMVGDGVNDAPALARATVGISMGKMGSASAIDASDVVFLQDDISLLDGLIKKSHDTMLIIKQNLSLALFVILFATTPALLGLVPLWLAVVLHEGGTLLVGLNSLRLIKN
jgi:Zn2+/Cd2+-exporting ATPase